MGRGGIGMKRQGRSSQGKIKEDAIGWREEGERDGDSCWWVREQGLDGYHCCSLVRKVLRVTIKVEMED